MSGDHDTPEVNADTHEPTLLRILLTERHWQKFSTFERMFMHSGEELATKYADPNLRRVSVSPRQFDRWYAGKVKTKPHPDACRILEYMFGFPILQLLAPAGTYSPKVAPASQIVTALAGGDEEMERHRLNPASQAAESEPTNETNRSSENLTDFQQIELLRHGLSDVFSAGTMSEASLDDWDRAVARYGRATRDRSAVVLLGDLSTDLQDLKRTLELHRSSSALRRLTRVAANMSGLMCLSFCKLDNRPAFRRWARTARLAAEEAGDPETLSWVLAQEAYGHYYSGDFKEALEIARHAHEVVRTPCVGAALAAALEARAQAVLGKRHETQKALGITEQILSNLEGDSLIPSAYGYNEASFRFHEGNAYTHLLDVKRAIVAQDRALDLGAPSDYTDWAMTRLDRSQCIAIGGDISSGLEYAIETLNDLTKSHRQGLITLRGREILNSLPDKSQQFAPARDLHEMLMLTTDEGKAI